MLNTLLAVVAAATLVTSTETTTRVRLATGVELDVQVQGPADGEPVLFLHGYGDSRFSWSRVLPLLPADIRAIVPTQRGHGASQRPACCFRVKDFANDAVALLDALGIERATVVGHSLGSLVAQRIAIDHPGRVQRLVLVGSGQSTRLPLFAELAAATRDLPDPVPEAFVREFQRSVLALPVPDTFFEGVVAESRKVHARVWRDVIDGLIAREAVDDNRAIDTPTLVVWGDQDPIWDRGQQDELVRRIRRAQLVVQPGVGHCPNWERPEAFTAELLRFLGR